MSYDKSHKIGLFIAALCAVTAWMVMEAWGDDQRWGRNRRVAPCVTVSADLKETCGNPGYSLNREPRTHSAPDLLSGGANF
jgi:hypothetical protein